MGRRGADEKRSRGGGVGRRRQGEGEKRARGEAAREDGSGGRQLPLADGGCWRWGGCM
jgi:hypothetical protein